MMSFRHLTGGAAVALLALLLTAGPLMATNGMNMIGYSARSSGMGGADAAVLSGSSGVSGNPAAMGRLGDRSAAIGISLLMPDLDLSNQSMGLELEGESQVFPLPYAAYSQRMGSNSPWILGAEVYAQGGMGVDFRGFPTGPTTSDDIYSQVMYLKLTGAASYMVSDAFTVGASIMGGYAGMEFSMFPGSPGGIDVEDLSSLGFAGRLGAHLRLTQCLSMGAVYTTETALDMDGGTAVLNFGAQGTAEYSAEMKDFTWPQEAEFGIALNPVPQLLIAADVKWIDWSEALGVVDLVVSDAPDGYPATPFPDGQGGYTDTMGFQMNWEDQMVYAVGAEYSINPSNAVRVGYNYGESPVPDDYLSPLFPAIVEQHLTLGYGLDLGNWGFQLGYEKALENSQTNDNTDQMVNPFGPGLTVSHSQNTIHFQTAYSF